MAINTTRRVVYQGGLLGAFRGESQGRALEREVVALNADGYRVTFIVPDRWNSFYRLLWLGVTILTAGFIARSPNLLIIGEQVQVVRTE